jgi:hypothetical protein
MRLLHSLGLQNILPEKNPISLEKQLAFDQRESPLPYTEDGAEEPCPKARSIA